MSKTKGRLTLPGDHDFFEETKELLERWGADAIRDSDGTKLEERVKDLDAKIYTTYFPARNDNEHALQNLDEVDQIFVMSEYNLATSDTVVIDFMKTYYDEQLEPDYVHDPKTWWQVYDRTADVEIPKEQWDVDSTTGLVTVKGITPYHEYTVNFLARFIWDPTQMYNHITNDWGDIPKDVPFDVRQPNSQQHMVDALTKFLENNPKTDVVRFTTFYYHFTLVFNDKQKDKFVDWFGYGASVSPAALIAFEEEYGYGLVAEDFIQKGTYNSTFNNPTQRYLDFIDFQQRFVSQQAKKLVDLVHSYGKEAMMFLGDNWIGTEPYGEYFADIGLDAVVGSVGGGSSLRVISDIPHVKYTEGRFLPYFFPDTFKEGNDPVIEASYNWQRSRRAIMRSPINRIGYGGYPSLAYKFPKFISYIEDVANQFRDIISKIEDVEPYSNLTVGILNTWGNLRKWQAFMVAHELYYKQTYSYYGMMDALSGMSVDVKFINFEDIANGVPEDIDVIINVGDAGTAFSGADKWDNPETVSILRQWVHEGHGFIGVGEPSAYQKGGRYFQLSDVLGVDREMGLTLSSNKYFDHEIESHFITDDVEGKFNHGEPVTNIYSNDVTTEVISMNDNNITMAAKQYGKGRGVYISGLPFDLSNTRVLYRSLFYAAGKEADLKKWFSSNYNCEVNVYKDANLVAILNNTSDEQTTIIYDGLGKEHHMVLAPEEIRWEEINEESIKS